MKYRAWSGVRSHPNTLTKPPVTTASIRVMLVDDHVIMLEGLVSLLTASGSIDVVASATDGQRAIELFDESKPDVSIVDLRMRPMDGVELTQKLRRLNPKARVIMLTTYDTDEDIFRGFQAGIATYIRKDTDAANLINAVHAVHAGQRIIDPQIAAKLAEHVAGDSLTARQDEVLQLVAEGKSNQEIGEQIHITEGTVKAHIREILRKLGARDRTQAVSFALRRGIVRHS